MPSGADTHTHIRTEVILRNQAHAWFKNQPYCYSLYLHITYLHNVIVHRPTCFRCTLNKYRILILRSSMH